MRRPRCTGRRRRLAGSGSSSSSCTRRRRMEPDDHASTAIRAACTFGDRDDLAKATAAVEHVISAVKAPQHRRPRQPSEVFAIDCNAGPRTGDIVSHQRPHRSSAVSSSSAGIGQVMPITAASTISRRASDLPLLVRKGSDLAPFRLPQRNPLHPIHRVAAFDRNRWPLSLGLGGRFPSESVAALARIPHCRLAMRAFRAFTVVVRSGFFQTVDSKRTVLGSAAFARRLSPKSRLPR